MSKNYQKAARGCLYALAVVIAGVCFSVKPAQSATCFLPSGNCSTGKIGGGPAPEATPEYCTGYNINQISYNAKYSNSSCFSCTSCTKTVDDKGTYYKCDEISGSNWDNQHEKCCTDNTKYDADEGACCPAGGCKHDCPAGKIWIKALKQCACPSDVETDSNGNCCAKGQVLENGSCTTPCEMNACDGYTYTTDPGNSESCNLGCNKGYRYKCKDGYTYSNGKCEKNDEVITIYLTNIETEEAINKTLTCNGHTESYGNILKESVHFSHDSTHNVNFKIYNKTRESNDRQFNKKTACSGLYDERITFNNGDTKVYAMYPNGNPEDDEIFGYYYNNYPTNYEVIVDGTTVASGSTVVSAREDVDYYLRKLHSLAGKVIEPSANNPYTIKFVYQEGEKCTPKDCSGYSAYVNGMNAEEDENLQTCDPGCGLALQYKCKDGYTYRGYGRCVSPCKRGYIDSYTNTCNDNPTCKCELREDNHSYCVKCDGTSSSTTYVAYSNNVYTGYYGGSYEDPKYPKIENRVVSFGSGAQQSTYNGRSWYFDIFEGSIAKFSGACDNNAATKASIAMNTSKEFTFKIYPIARLSAIRTVTIYNPSSSEKYCFGVNTTTATNCKAFDSQYQYLSNDTDKRISQCFSDKTWVSALGSEFGYATFKVTLKPNTKYVIEADTSY